MTSLLPPKHTHTLKMFNLHTLLACSCFKVYFYLQSEMMHNKEDMQLQTYLLTPFFMKKYINILQ